MAEPAGFLTDLWYHALPSAALKVGAMQRVMLLGEPVLLLRDVQGTVSAMRDVCPHRAIPLSCGTFDGHKVECCYHGWKFATDGQCTEIPALVGGEQINVEKIRVRGFSVAERQGQIWLWFGDGDKVDMDMVPTLPSLPLDATPKITINDLFPCHVDHAVVGLMDPAHGPFVHQSWWWRKRTSMHEKAKKFGPTLLGFAMLRHRPSKNAGAYKLLGGTPETEIAFRLPGIRIEQIAIGRHTVVNLTAVTPVSETETRITNSIYWTQSWLWPLTPLVKLFAKQFLGQDRNVVVKQQEGLKYERNLLLIRDADTQARWYYQLKAEWQRAQVEERPFANPVRETTLRWKS